jgi:hypothetical protein
MLVIFEKFCKLKGLKINVGKTKAMQINMDCTFMCNDLPVENVCEFKYLGLFIDRAQSSPTVMLEKRINKA